MNAWIGIIGTVIGTIIGGGLAWLNMKFQLQIQEERERKKLLLGKLEEIHELLSKYKHSFTMATMEHLRATFTSESKLFENLPPVPAERLRMLIGFYAPELKEHFRNLEALKEEWGEASGEHLKMNKLGQTEGKKALGWVFHRSKKIDAACEAIQEKVIEMAKQYL
jgi:hypothetical protein